MGDKTSEISVVLPSHNEGNTIYEMISETVLVLEELGYDYEIIVVDDGSTDNTPAEINRAVSEFNRVASITLPENMGKGNALRRGFLSTSKELVCFLDADLDLHPSQIKEFTDSMERTGADILVGSKRHPDAVVDYPWYRRLYSSIYHLLILILFRLPVRDTQAGIKVFRREVLKMTLPRLVCKKYTLDLELLVVAGRMGYTAREAPIRLDFRKKYGRIRWSDIRNIIVDTMGIFYRLYILRYYDSPLKPVGDYRPSFSIVIPTREVDEMVRECLQKSCELDYSDFAIKLLPDGPVDDGTVPPGVDVIPSGEEGPSIKRNMGAESSDADVIAFIDSDAWPEMDWLLNASAYFEDREVAAVCGPAVTPPNDSRRQQVSGHVYSSSLVSGNTTNRYRYHAMREVEDYPSCNLLVRRSDFFEAGRYPEEYWPGEDTVLCMRLTKELGKKIIYVPNVIVYHHRREVYMPHLRQVYAYAKHRGYFARKFPQTSRKIQYFVPSLFVAFLALGWLPGMFFRPLLYSYLSIIGLYLLLCLMSSVKTLDLLINAMVFPGIMVTNLTYGVGFVFGLLSRRMER